MDEFLRLIEAVNTGLNVVKKVVDLPGVNALPYATTLSNAIAAVQTAAEAGMSVLPYIEAIKDTFSGDTPPTEAQLSELDAKIDELRAKLHAPLPPKEDGEDEA